MGVAMVMNTSIGNDDYYLNTTEITSTVKRYRPRTLSELTARTKFTSKEVQIIYQAFKQECPTGLINERTFQNIFRQYFPFADTTSYAHLIFSTFDLHSTTFVTFEDFLLCLSSLCRGTTEDRLKWIFKLYDTKKRGRLTKDDFALIISAIYALLGNASNRPWCAEGLREYSADVFDKFDHAQRGYLTFDDFSPSACTNQ